MEQSSFQDEQTVRHQFDSLCKLALKSEVINYEKHMAYRQKYEVMLSELSEKELSRLFIMDDLLKRKGMLCYYHILWI